MTEIDKDFYCSAGFYDKGGSCAHTWMMHDCLCNNCHRKYPTPEQFKEEYETEWQGAFYFKCKRPSSCLNEKCLYWNWTIIAPVAFMDCENGKLSHECAKNIVRICSCSPWGIPPINRSSEM